MGKKRYNFGQILTSLLAVLLLWVNASAQTQPTLRLPALLGNNMVLQSGVPAPIWGWAAPGQKITVKIAQQSKSTTADASGKWALKLDMLPSGGPYEMTVEGGTSITIKNILVGEIWVCSGQSNMAMPVAEVRNAPEEIAAANDPKLRYFQVPNIPSAKPLDDCGGRWVECSSATVPTFSATGYFFGAKLRKELKVPVGLISSNWGGTSAESWTSQEGLRSAPELSPIVDRWDAALKIYPSEKLQYDQKMAAYALEVKNHPEYKKNDIGWESANFTDDDWQTMRLPQLWTDAGLQILGTIWFRKSVDIPADWVGKRLLLSLGKINNADVTYVNGTKVGNSGELASERKYQIPASLIQGTKVTIAVKVANYFGCGGFPGKPELFSMTLADIASTPPVSLAGDWKYSISDGKVPQPNKPLGDPGNSGAPASLYNGMISPLLSEAIKGVIWYQGEANAVKAFQYRTLLPTLIKDWRSHWGVGDFPFLIVQLASYMAPSSVPSEGTWAELREAQLMALKTPGTGLAVAVDIGEGNNIHPKNKQDVGMRLALWALAKTYGQSKLVYSGPLYQSMSIEEGRIRLKFSNVGSGLAAKDGKSLRQFAIAGEDKRWVWADAVVDGTTVLVSSNKVPKPIAVRYAWANNPEGCNLINNEGLPASPFRTDDWPGLTVNSQ